jgi:uncharacterized protein YidB (DUF937 family)
MGLLDSVMGMLNNGQPGGASGALVQQIGQMLAGNAASGGLAELAQSFERGGLGHIISSWIGTGQNLPVSAEQIQQVLGQGRIGQLAQSVGLQPDQVSAQLAHLLPGIIDHLTPHGQIPAQGIGHSDVAGALGAILSKAAGATPTS